MASFLYVDALLVHEAALEARFVNDIVRRHEFARTLDGWRDGSERVLLSMLDRNDLVGLAVYSVAADRIASQGGAEWRWQEAAVRVERALRGEALTDQSALAWANPVRALRIQLPDLTKREVEFTVPVLRESGRAAGAVVLVRRAGAAFGRASVVVSWIWCGVLLGSVALYATVGVAIRRRASRARAFAQGEGGAVA